MVKKTRRQKERAAKRREYLARLAKVPEVKEEISKKEVPEEAEVHLERRPEREEVKAAKPKEVLQPVINRPQNLA